MRDYERIYLRFSAAVDAAAAAAAAWCCNISAWIGIQIAKRGEKRERSKEEKEFARERDMKKKITWQSEERDI